MKSGAGTDDIYKPNLWYFDSLMFLKDHEMPRSSIGSDCPEFIDALSQVNILLITFIFNLYYVEIHTFIVDIIML